MVGPGDPAFNGVIEPQRPTNKNGSLGFFLPYKWSEKDSTYN